MPRTWITSTKDGWQSADHDCYQAALREAMQAKPKARRITLQCWERFDNYLALVDHRTYSRPQAYIAYTEEG